MEPIYESNSFKAREARRAEAVNESVSQEKRVEKVSVGKVKTKKNTVRKFSDIFISEDIHSVKSYIFMDVLVPAIKKAVSDIVTNGVDMILYGETGRSKKTSSGSKVSYVSYYDRHKDDSRDGRRTVQSGFDYEDLVFETRGAAEAVRSQMDDVIEKYGFVTVADMYDIVDMTAPYTSNKYGWTNLRNAEPVRVKEGYILKLPKAEPIHK